MPRPVADDLISRRPVLLAGLATTAATVLVGCSSGDPSGSSSDPSEAASSSGSGGSGSSSDPIVAVSAVPVGGAVAAKDGEGKPIIVSQPRSGDIVAFTAICTHKGCTVAPSGAQLKCPCHGSVYDAFTGKNVSGPAPRPLAPVQVTVADGKVMPG